MDGYLEELKKEVHERSCSSTPVGIQLELTASNVESVKRVMRTMLADSKQLAHTARIHIPIV